MVCIDGTSLNKVFGMGIAYPTETNDGIIAKNESIKKTRADSFSLYQGWVSNRILLSLLNTTLLKSKV